LGPALGGNWERCGKAKWRQHSLLEEYAEFLLGLIVEHPDLTLAEIVAAMRKKALRAAAARCGGSSLAVTSASKRSQTASPLWG
jgi:hypothetical protein